VTVTDTVTVKLTVGEIVFTFAVAT